ncbi:MAG: iron chelate uptake ABC transporter family permease subunit [Beutenbergiaceae bacterium]
MTTQLTRVSKPTATSAPPVARRQILTPFVAVILLASLIVAVAIGPASLASASAVSGPITAMDIVGSAWHHLTSWLSSSGFDIQATTNPLSPVRDAIIWDGRMPRALTAAAVGAGLAICGVVLQATTRNPLADPYLLGISSGASLGAVAVLILGWALPLPIAAFVGAMAALVTTLALAGWGDRLQAGRVLLAGIAVAQACSAAVSLVIFTTAQGDSYRNVLGWLMGTLGAARWSSVLVTGIAVLVLGAVLMGFGRTLDGFAFGDISATSLGINVVATRWLLLVLTALLTGALVSMSGAIGFVGLTVPHVVRLLPGVGPGNPALLRASALVGAVFLLWADTIARTAFAPLDIPVGVLTALIGAPVFAVLLLRSRRRIS